VWVQLSSVNAVEITDINGDNRPDLVMGGNMFTFPPQFGRLDASYGHLMINEGSGKFRYVMNRESGMNVRGAMRSLKQITTKKGTYIIATVNNEQPVIWAIKK